MKLKFPLQSLSRFVASAQDEYRQERSALRGQECERFLGEAGAQFDRKISQRKVMASLALGVLLALGVWAIWRSGVPELSVAGVPLQQEEGVWLSASKSPLPLSFSDGSLIELAPETRARMVHARSLGTQLTVELGRVDATLKTRRGHEWRFDAGPFVVKGRGADFVLIWHPSDQHFEVTLTGGYVHVVGPILGESKLVEAGHNLRVSVQDSLAVLSSVPTQP